MDSSHVCRSELPRSDPVIPRSPQELPSSPPSIASDAGARRKPKRPPPVTPRSFKRFFTPRSILNGGSNPGSVRTNRQALMNLNSPAVNHRLGPAFRRTPKPVENQIVFDEPTPAVTPSRKRKLSFSSVGSPLQSSPLRKVRVRTPIHDQDDEIAVPVKDIKLKKEAQHGEQAKAPAGEHSPPVTPIRRSSALQSAGGLYVRSVHGSRANRTTIRSNSGTGWSPVSVL